MIPKKRMRKVELRWDPTFPGTSSLKIDNVLTTYRKIDEKMRTIKESLVANLIDRFNAYNKNDYTEVMHGPLCIRLYKNVDFFDYYWEVWYHGTKGDKPRLFNVGRAADDINYDNCVIKLLSAIIFFIEEEVATMLLLGGDNEKG